MQKCIQHNKDERTQFFRKIYLSLYLKGFERVTKGIICERWVGDWTELQHIDPPNSSGYSSISFPFSWAAQPGAWGPSLSRTWSSFQHLLSNSSEALNYNCSIGGPEGPLCWVLILSTASYLQLTRTSCAPSYIIVLRPLNSTCRQSRLSPWYLQPDAPVNYTGAFPILTAWPGRRSIYNNRLAKQISANRCWNNTVYVLSARMRKDKKSRLLVWFQISWFWDLWKLDPCSREKVDWELSLEQSTVPVSALAIIGNSLNGSLFFLPPNLHLNNTDTHQILKRGR